MAPLDPAPARGDQQVPGHGTPVGNQSYFPDAPSVPSRASADSEAPDAVVAEPQESPEEPEATDAAVAKAAELGVDLTEVQGTGQDGRITVEDVESAAEPTSAE